MESRASINGHPIHPMLVVFPIGLWVFSFVADLLFIVTGNNVWSAVAYYTMGGGILGALVAAIPGMVDLFSITTGRTRVIGLIHMSINLVVVVLFVINFWIRTSAEVASTGAIWFSGISVALLAISGWLGGELVFRHRVGVQER
jgi:uncharacterized membrane protein